MICYEIFNCGAVGVYIETTIHPTIHRRNIYFHDAFHYLLICNQIIGVECV